MRKGIIGRIGLITALFTTVCSFGVCSAATVDYKAGVEVSVEHNQYVSGDIFTAEVKMTGLADEKAAGVGIGAFETRINFDNTKLDVSVMESNISIVKQEGDNISLNADEVNNIATINFKAIDKLTTGASTLTIGHSTTSGENSVIDKDYASYSVTDNNLTETPLSINVAKNVNKVTVDDEEVTAGTTPTFTKAEGVTVKFTSTDANASATIAKDSTYIENIDKTNGYKAESSGIYTVTVYTVEGKETFSFTLVTETVEAILDSEISNKSETGYAPGSTFEVPVTISGLGDKEAAMVTFDVMDVDRDSVTLTSVTNENNNAEFTDVPAEGKNTAKYTVKVGTTGAEAGIANNGTVVTLTFTVKDSVAKYGGEKFYFDNEDVALVTDAINPAACKASWKNNGHKITIVPADNAKFVTVTAPADQSWTNQPYDLAVADVEGVSCSVAYVWKDANDTVNTDQKTLEELWNVATFLPYDNKTIKINDDAKTLYVLAELDDVYQLVEKIEAKDTMYDTTDPQIVVTNANDNKWVKDEFVLDLSNIAVTDSKSGASTTIQYKLGDTTAEFTTADGAIKVTESGKLTIKGFDNAGNSNTAETTVKVDKVAPTIDIKEFAISTDGKRATLITVSDTESGVDTVKYTKVESAEAIPGDDAVYTTLTENNGSYELSEREVGTHYFYVVVTDKVGHATVERTSVTIEKLTSASVMEVSVIRSSSSSLPVTKAAFKTTTAIDEAYSTMNYGGSNGKFTYVKINVAKPKEGYKNVVKINGVEESENSAGGVSKILDYNQLTFNEGVEGIDYTVEITTSNNNDTTDTKTDTYKFSIVKPDDMVSVNNDKYFNIIDFALIKRVIANKTGEDTDVIPVADDNFKGGIFSGDLNGDFTLTTADYEVIITSIKAGKVHGQYTFDKLNRVTTQEAE